MWIRLQEFRILHPPRHDRAIGLAVLAGAQLDWKQYLGLHQHDDPLAGPRADQLASSIHAQVMAISSGIVGGIDIMPK